MKPRKEMIRWAACARTTLVAILALAFCGDGRASIHRDKGYRYLSPVPGAEYSSPQTRFVLIRFEDITPAEVTNLTTTFVTVTGANSGPHSGATHVAADGRTVILELSGDFSPNELVTVTLNPQVNLGAGGSVEPYEYQFMVTAPMPGSVSAAASSSPGIVPAGDSADEENGPDGPGQGPVPAGNEAGGAVAMIKSNGISVPSDFPEVVITVNSNPSPGYVFALNKGQGSHLYWMILDNGGLPVWYRRGGGLYFRVQENEMISMVESYEFTTVYDRNFNFIKHCRALNGYATDSHEIEVLEDGSYLLLGYRDNPVNMSHYVIGGQTNATVFETVIQEFTAAGELIFQWRAWDHFDVRDIQGGINLQGTVPHSHMNALDVDEDGHLLLSSRELGEVTKIHRDTGEIIWRLSGKNSSFVFLNDPLNGFNFQHDISALGNGRYMVFDNGNGHYPPVSRAVEYQLNLTNMTATMVWQYRDTPDKYSWVMGNAQRLPTGNTLINFVQAHYPAVIEVDSNGVKRFEMTFAPNIDHYQTHRFPWHGVVEVPYLILEPDRTGLNLIFNKFGDTNVAYYRIYGGPSPQPTTHLANSSTTLKRLTNLENGMRYYFRVTAVNAQGAESGYSNEENLTVNIIKPGDQMVQNGDFSAGTNFWNWAVAGGASAQWKISNAVSFCEIVNGGSSVPAIQLWQAGKPLMQGQKYAFEFDAWSQGPRYIEAKVGQAVAPFVNYSRIGFSFLTPIPTHFCYVFTMPEASDFNSSVMFNLGGSVLDVHVDNVSLVNTLPGDFNLDGLVDQRDLVVMTGEWQKQQTGLVSDLDGNGKVDFNDFAILGENWKGAGP